MSATLVAVLAVVVVLLGAVLIGASVAAGRRGRRSRGSTGVVSAWGRRPATRPTKTVRVLRDPDEVASAADRAAARERETARQISERAERISRLSHRRRHPGD